MEQTIENLKAEMRNVLNNNILRYWVDYVLDKEEGGFYGQVDGHNNVIPTADKGAIQNARALWAFSAAYRITKNEDYLDVARRTKDYFIMTFIDKTHGGVYWSVDYKGNPLDTKKQSYAIGFAIYGLSEYFRATGDEEALEAAKGLFYDLEKHAYDAVNNGYIEALTQEWQPIADMRLSEKDENGSKTMNTHLHIIEPYTNLYRVWKNEKLGRQLKNLLSIFLDKILNAETHHLDLFFDDEWQGKRNIQSFGHDIEASWLLHETAMILEDETLLERVRKVIPKIAKAASEGLQADGSMIYEKWTDSGETDCQRQWWVMCECIVGYIDLYQYLNDTDALQKALACWAYVKTHLIDNVHGEWYWSCDENGKPDHRGDKAGFWKCPYHNGRMCLEIIERDIPTLMI